MYSMQTVEQHNNYMHMYLGLHIFFLAILGGGVNMTTLVQCYH